MKIGVTTFGGDGGKSGISRYIIRLLDEFRALRDGDEMEVIAYDDEREIFLPDTADFSALTFGPKLRSTLRNLLWHQLSLPKLCKRQEYDVLFLPAGNRRLPMSAPCPTVGTVHDFSSLHVKGKYDPARHFYITKVLPKLVGRLSQVLTPSESSKRDIVELANYPEERVHVTPLSADSTLYHPREQEECLANIPERFGIRAPYVLYISRIEHPGKNHVRLIRAFDRLKSETGLPHQLVLAGSDWGRTEAVYEEADKCQHKEDIVFTGFAPDECLPYLYSGADLFVFPSLYEGFGLPVLEALSSGVATACSNLSSMPEVAGDAALQFDPYDEDAITDSMRRILENEELKRSLVERGLGRSSQFTWQRTAEQTLDVIRNAAEEKMLCHSI